MVDIPLSCTKVTPHLDPDGSQVPCHRSFARTPIALAAPRALHKRRVEDRFNLLPVSVGSWASSFTPCFQASASISRTIGTQRASPAPPHRTVRAVLPHTALRCSSPEGIHVIFVPPNRPDKSVESFCVEIDTSPPGIPAPPGFTMFLAQEQV
jgi:hypothetical protein